jgi:hypothetical protein
MILNGKTFIVRFEAEDKGVKYTDPVTTFQYMDTVNNVENATTVSTGTIYENKETFVNEAKQTSARVQSNATQRNAKQSKAKQRTAI